MARIRHSSEQIIAKLREADVLLGQGMKMPEVCKRLGVTEQTYYRWRKEYGGLKVNQARKLKELENENALRGRLKKLVADLSVASRCSKRSPGDASARRSPTSEPAEEA